MVGAIETSGPLPSVTTKSGEGSRADSRRPMSYLQSMEQRQLLAAVEAALAEEGFKRLYWFRPWTWWGSAYEARRPRDAKHFDLIASKECTQAMCAVLKQRKFHAETFQTTLLRDIHIVVVGPNEEVVYWALHYYGWTSPQVYVREGGGYRQL
jgi:hypothetical protein